MPEAPRTHVPVDALRYVMACGFVLTPGLPDREVASLEEPITCAPCRRFVEDFVEVKGFIQEAREG